MSDQDEAIRDFLRNSPHASELTEEEIQNLSHIDRSFVGADYQGYMRDLVFRVASADEEGIQRSSYYVVFVKWNEEIGPQLYQIITEEAAESLVAWHNENHGPEDQDPDVHPFLYKVKLKKNR